MLKFLADMCISPITVTFLKEEGYDTIHVKETNMSSAKDEDILNYAAKENRVLITQDLDFSAMLAVSGKSTPGIITLRLKFPSPNNINEVLQKILNSQPHDMIKNSLIIAEETRIRTRKLPVKSENTK